MDNNERAIWSLVALGTVILLLALLVYPSQKDRAERSCINLGGVPVLNSSGTYQDCKFKGE